LELEATQEMSKQLKASSKSGLPNWLWGSEWSVDSKSFLHIMHLLTKIFSLFC